MIKRVSIIISSFLMLVSLGTQAGSKAVSIKIEPEIALNGYRALVEEYLSGVLRTTRAIAFSSEAKSGRWELVKPILERYGKDLKSDALAWYALPDGSYFSTETGGLTEQNLKDRDYFQSLLKGKDVLNELVISKSTGHRSIIVATPVVVDGKVMAAVGVSVRARLLSELVESDIKLPPDTYFYAMNANAKISLHRYMDRMFKQVKDVGDELLEEQFKNTFKKESGVFNYELQGKKLTSIYEKSRELGWYFFIAQEVK